MVKEVKPNLGEGKEMTVELTGAAGYLLNSIHRILGFVEPEVPAVVLFRALVRRRRFQDGPC
jgi:hypothetical protein